MQISISYKLSNHLGDLLHLVALKRYYTQTASAPQTGLEIGVYLNELAAANLMQIRAQNRS